jgi:hypothetical protein
VQREGAVANAEHLNVLRQGVKAWNQWRKEHPETRPDLRKADLVGASLRAYPKSPAARHVIQAQAKWSMAW